MSSNYLVKNDSVRWSSFSPSPTGDTQFAFIMDGWFFSKHVFSVTKAFG
jgi:hypothetical protein